MRIVDYNYIIISQLFTLAVALCGCKQKYLPPVLRASKNNFVVEGVIVPGQNINRLMNDYLPPTGPRFWVFQQKVTRNPGNVMLANAVRGDGRPHGDTTIKPSFWQ